MMPESHRPPGLEFGQHLVEFATAVANSTLRQVGPGAPQTAPRSRIRDVIVPGSIRMRHIEYDEQIMTIRCGRCGSEFDVYAYNRTTRCKACGRVCRIDQARGSVLRAVGGSDS